MHKRAFQVLKPTFMHVSGFPPTCIDKKLVIYILVFLSKYNEENLRHA